MTADGFEKSIQVAHIAHVALVLPLLDNFGPQGRIVLFASDAYEPGKNNLEVFPPSIPDDDGELDRLVRPTADAATDNFGHGFLRYAKSKLAIVLWGHALNRRLQEVSRQTGRLT